MTNARSLTPDAVLPPLLHLQLIRDPQSPTGQAHVYLTAADENHIVVLPGANYQLCPSDIPDLVGVTHLPLQLETPTPTVQTLALMGRSQHVTVVLNASPATEVTPELLRVVDLLIVNEGEARDLAQTPAEPPLHQVAATLCRSGPSVVITRGAHGSLALHNDPLIDTSGYPVKAVSTVGAGDAFTGTFVAALSLGTPWAEALIHANAAGALTCTRPGALEAQPFWPELTAFLQSQGDPNEKIHY
ncbi:PfkB family carbohydrate kinase [Deinococcus humi]|uniref:PfkB family carbohydrate kinase n=1 Tax=Deinococcus humi TaxID=662880 RepID=UPI0019C53594|nr:PfkB family carbohydrate kinase [Deinococcus humi]GGO30387.1 hypothetical protein GCM10008949_25200 [Deinococcus humi]